MKKIVICGATGMIGKKISNALIDRGDNVTILSRSSGKAKKIIPNAAEYVDWDIRTKNWFDVLEGKDAVLNLAGENIMAKRWTEPHKRNIIISRVETTGSLVEAIKAVTQKPKIFLSASAVGYYGNSEFQVDENSLPGNNFLAHVVDLWEKASKDLESNVRRVNIRIGMVLETNEGALAKMIPAFKYFVGGPLGSGNQWFPWIHINDVTGIFLFALDNDNVDGIINAVSPNPVRMKEFCKTLGKVMNRPSILKVPEFILKLVFGEAAEAILGGAKVIPKKTEAAGYKFIFSDLEKALKDLL